MRYLFVLAAATILLSCASADPCTENINRDTFRVSVSKGACFGQCPVYEGSILGDGGVTYMGRMNTEKEGAFSGSVDKQLVCRLIEIINENGLMSAKEDRLEPVQDAPETTVKILYNGVERTIRWNLGTPQEFEELVEIVVNNTHENNELRAVTAP